MTKQGLPGSGTSRRAEAAPQRKDTGRLFTAALLLAASPVTMALAQGTTLPPLSVETAAPKKKTAPAKGPAQAAPPPSSPASAPEPAGLPPGSYNVERSASPKMTAPLLDTPQTVTVVPGTVIEERGATNLTETLRNTPGISFSAGENAFTASTNNFQIRGFDASGAVYIDGVRDSGSYARDMYNVDRVEVVKGAAADNGRGNAGGYVNIITKTPLLHNFVAGEASIAFDEYDSEIRKRSTIDVNQAYGSTAVRLNGMIEDGGVAGREIAEANAWALAPSIAFGLGTPFRAIFSYEHLERHDLPDWGIPGQMMKGIWRYNPIDARASRDNFYGLRSDFDDVTSDALMARFEYDIAPGFTLSNQTRWSETDRIARFTFPNPAGTTTIPGGVVTTTQFYDRTNTSLSNQTNLFGTMIAAGLKHVISTGVEVMREESDANRYANVNPGNTDIFNPNPDRAGPAPFVSAATSSARVDTVAAYFYDTIHLSRQWQLTGGVRLEHYEVELNGANLPGSHMEDDATTLGGKIGLVYKPVSNGSFYASYGVSALPPGSLLSNPDVSRTGPNAFPGLIIGADPIEMTNYEIGTKWDFFGGRLSATAALFRTEKSNVPYNGVAPDPAIVYGKEIVQGLELGLAGNVTERWKVFGGVLLMESERDHGAAVDRAAQGDYVVDPDDAPTFTGVTTTNGDELAFTPKFMATLWTTYMLTDRWTVGGGIQYVGESWLGRPDDATRIIPNGKFGKSPDYFLVNFMTSYALTDKVDLRFSVDNVFDEFYPVSVNWTGKRVLPGAPRTFRLGTSFKF